MTQSVINRLAFQLTLNELKLREYLTIVATPQEAVHKVEELHNDVNSGEGFALLILDIEESNSVSLKKVIHEFQTKLT